MLQHFLSSVFIVVGWFSINVSGAHEAATDSATQRYMGHIMAKVDQVETRFNSNLTKFQEIENDYPRLEKWEQRAEKYFRKQFSHCLNPYDTHTALKEIIRAPQRAMILSAFGTTVGIACITVPPLVAATGAVGVPASLISLNSEPVITVTAGGAAMGICMATLVGAPVGAVAGLIWGPASIPIFMGIRQLGSHYMPSFYTLMRTIYKAHRKISALDVPEVELIGQKDILLKLEEKYFAYMKACPEAFQKKVDHKVSNYFSQFNRK